MTYEEALKHVFAKGSVPDGYDETSTKWSGGPRAYCKFAFDVNSGKTLVVHDTGYFSAPIPLAYDAKEALFLLQNHPSARNITAKPL